jgi:glycosyltransferase involved in cell wall biosynthesis
MRVAMVSEHASPLANPGGMDAGGQNVFVADLGRALARRGVEVTVFTRRDDPALPVRVAMAPRLLVEHVNAGPPAPVPKDLLPAHMAAFADVLSRAWSRRRPDVVHAHFWMSGRAALAAGHPLDVPVVQTFHALGAVKRRHQAEKDTSPPERVAEECRIAATADQVLATCSDELFELARLGANPHRVSIVPCGVDLDLFRPEGPALPRGRWRHRVAIVSRLVERKGIGNLIAALTGVPDCELVVAGGPPAHRLAQDSEYQRLRRLAANAGVADRVRFLGGVARVRVPELVRSADVVACVPWYEPFGMTALEAMGCGVPVLATAVGGLVDTVVDGVTGLHVPPRYPDAVAWALRELLARPGLRATMGRAAVERTRARYGWETIAARTLAVYARGSQRRRAGATEEVGR